ncbi:MAG: MIP/aquaporin family protein [Pseudomonadota bacterium]
MTLLRRLTAETLGTAFLLATVVGSGIMGERLADGNSGIALLANSIATGAVLATLIITFAGISGAHFNPAVTLIEAFDRRIEWRIAPLYWIAQISGALIGVVSAHLMFESPLISLSQHTRTGGAQMFSEAVATFGLIMVIFGSRSYRVPVTACTVAAYITGAYWFTASTSFANPAVTLARSLTDTFSGIRPQDVTGFVGAQLIGAMAAMLLFKWLLSTDKTQNQ